MNANELEEDIIKIDLKEFKNKLNEYDNNIPENIKKKYCELIKTYSCFTYRYDAKSIWEKKKLKKFTNNNLNTNKNRIYTFTSLSDNNVVKKNMISYLNKITNNNKESILENITKLINSVKDDKVILDELYNILLVYIGKNNDNVYESIIKIFINYDKNIFLNYITKFYEEKLWFPYDFILNNNILDDKYYNDYCDYVKWKNKHINVIKIYCKIIFNEFENTIINKLLIDIYDSFDNYMNNIEKKYILDYLLELMNIILKYNKNQKIINNLKNINLDTIDNSTKFLILNILEN